MSPHHFLFLASSRNCRTQRIRGAGDSNRMYIAPIVGLLTLPSSGPHSSLQVDWTIHPTPAGISSILQLVMAISHIMLDWSHRVFDPQTKSGANGRARLLMMDRFGAHESFEVLQFCHENHVVLCRLPSHTSHQLQPCGRHSVLSTQDSISQPS